MRGLLVVFMFFVGLAGGGLAYIATAPRMPDNPYKQMDRIPEPAAGASVATAVAAGDARALARQLDKDILKQLGNALEPLVDVHETKFVGAVDRDGRVFSAYVAQGKDPRGGKVIVGFVLRVLRDKVVGVN